MKVGDIVISILGHDTGEWYLVKRIDEQFVYLINGKTKTVDNPKKKKIKHIYKTEYNSNELAFKLINENYIQNAEIRKALKFFKNINQRSMYVKRRCN